jgi:hypothetical protein
MFRPKPKLRGRPKGSGNLKKPENKCTKSAKLSPELWDFIQSQRLENESLSQTIFRLIRGANHERNKLLKKVAALEDELSLALERHPRNVSHFVGKEAINN